MVSRGGATDGDSGSNEHVGAAKKRIYYLHVTKVLFILEIFAKQISALGRVRS